MSIPGSRFGFGHPNVILAVAFKPDGLARQTYRAMLAANDSDEDDPTIVVGQNKYSLTVMESDYDEGSQISADEGDIVAHDFVTYGYGETISWRTLEDRAGELESWARQTAKDYNCSYIIFITANYW